MWWRVLIECGEHDVSVMERQGLHWGISERYSRHQPSRGCSSSRVWNDLTPTRAVVPPVSGQRNLRGNTLVGNDNKQVVCHLISTTLAEICCCMTYFSTRVCLGPQRLLFALTLNGMEMFGLV